MVMIKDKHNTPGTMGWSKDATIYLYSITHYRQTCKYNQVPLFINLVELPQPIRGQIARELHQSQIQISARGGYNPQSLILILILNTSSILILNHQS